MGSKANRKDEQSSNKPVRRYLCAERKDIIHAKIPKGDTADGDEFAEVEIEVQPFVQQVDDEVIQSQTDDGNDDE